MKKSKCLFAPNALLKFCACSTESVPTRASPTMMILSGLAALAKDANGAINCVSLCLLPAVSNNTMSKLFCFAYLIAPVAILATKSAPPYPPSNSSICCLSWDSLVRLLTWVRNCSTAPDLNVSHAVISTRELATSGATFFLMRCVDNADFTFLTSSLVIFLPPIRFLRNPNGCELASWAFGVGCNDNILSISCDRSFTRNSPVFVFVPNWLASPTSCSKLADP
ncbi:hypothetical protein OGAPHI_001511 [Ogataea philodendri]|uniref:Uncharacterized protein n=1 Tax=Ogataea philodendri TaxID=1378263 RepID=A0A9P8PCX8_9ASCO|nr:uncharacterized protein OGAPHI_001511 [Ogataea philodendri]KAH3669390.1 hypothetical protein OGAPHI_001511 [Ogataea philodendri]